MSRTNVLSYTFGCTWITCNYAGLIKKLSYKKIVFIVHNSLETTENKAKIKVYDICNVQLFVIKIEFLFFLVFIMKKSMFILVNRKRNDSATYTCLYLHLIKKKITQN